MRLGSQKFLYNDMNTNSPNDNAVVRDVQIENKMGLHARPAMLLAELANKFNSDITIHKGEQAVNAKSIMEVLLLAAGKGTTLTIKAQGSDAQQAVDAIANLIEKEKFEEE